MPLLRSAPASLSRAGALVRPTSIRGRILALLAEDGVKEAVSAAPVTVADLALSVPCPEGKNPEQWKKEIGSVLATDLKEGGALSRALVRCAPGRFTVPGSPLLAPAGDDAPAEVAPAHAPVDEAPAPAPARRSRRAAPAPAPSAEQGDDQ